MKFYSEKDMKTIAATAATTATIEATATGRKKAAATGCLGMILGAAITLTTGRSYVKKIESKAEESCRSLKKDINILRAGIEEVDKTFDKLPAGTINLAEMPAFVEARKLITEKGGMKLPDPKEDKKEDKKKKGGDK